MEDDVELINETQENVRDNRKLKKFTARNARDKTVRQITTATPVSDEAKQN